MAGNPIHAMDATVCKANSILEDWFSSTRSDQPDLNLIHVPVYIKNADAIITAANDAYQRFFSRGKRPIGRSENEFLFRSIAEVARSTDSMILSNVSQTYFDHVGLGPDGLWYEIQSYKSNLSRFQDSAFKILGISIPIKVCENEHTPDAIERMNEIFQSFAELEQAICFQSAAGKTNKEIAVAIGISQRSIELKRRNILDQLGLVSLIDLVKLMVRLDERGMLPANELI